ncbi:MAG: HEAT repeat domain-containing protein [Treponema sp.]|jgi:HEAT repeat protein|nr:HEAT repeat domain-containing protein [Treponema sp.]
MYRKIAVCLFFLPLASLFPQEFDDERSGELSYSPNYVDVILIREQSRTPDRNVKMSALTLIEKTLNGEYGGDAEILSALEFLSFEGVINKERLNGVLVNNYPDVRLRAAKSLGNFGGPDAKRILLQSLRSETETMVLTQTVRALSMIGVAEEDEPVLNGMMRRFDTRYPDNALAIAFLDAYQGVMEQRRISLATRELILRISQAKYRSSVKKKAKELLRLNSRP